ncbi:MAG: hypothetical protein HY286_19655 [Planctomycetes bacterium]|nr:hypothetical protein [Planctomycetota bacterium]
MFEFIFEFIFDFVFEGIFYGFPKFIGRGTPELDRSRRARALRRKLARYVKNAPDSAFTGSEDRYLSPGGAVLPDARGRLRSICKKVGDANAQDWESLCCGLLEIMARDMPGLIIQLPPDEPRMVYAGDKQL